jgi:hypothetical protein
MGWNPIDADNQANCCSLTTMFLKFTDVGCLDHRKRPVAGVHVRIMATSARGTIGLGSALERTAIRR